MDKKKLTILIIVILIILAVILIAVFGGNKTLNKPTNSNNLGQANNSVASRSADYVPSPAELGNSAPKTSASVQTPQTGSSTAVKINNTLSVMPGSPEAPKQETVDSSKIPDKAIKLSVSESGFTPKEFSVTSGQAVSLAITSVGSGSHVFLFPDATLMALTVMVSNGETKIINFTAPAAGSYLFRDDLPAFRANTGTMIVK